MSRFACELWLTAGLICLSVGPFTSSAAAQSAPTDHSNELLQRLERAELEIRELQLKTAPQPVQNGFADGDFSSLEPDRTSLRQRLQSLEQRFDELRRPKPEYPGIEIHGVFQADTGWFDQDPNSIATLGNIQDGADFRRARLSANGALLENVNYFFQMDFAFPGRPTFTDVWFEVTKVPILGNVRAGQWKQPFSLEVVSSFRYTTFPERSLLFQAFVPFRHIAVGFYDWAENERMTWAASVYRSGQDQFGDSIADSGGYAGVGRITGLPWWDESCDGAAYLHLGAAYNYVAPNNRVARFRTIPEFFIGEQAPGVVGTAGIANPGPINGTPFFVDTLAFGVNHYHLAGTELLWVEGPLSVQSEFMWLSATRTNGVGAYFPGMYVTVGYFLTGEHRPYNRKLGQIDRVKPFRNLSFSSVDGAGWGAWELAARWSSIDLNSKDIQGGRLDDVTLGLNWYLNPNIKVQFNYIRAMLANPVHGDSNTNIYGLRAQMDF